VEVGERWPLLVMLTCAASIGYGEREEERKTTEDFYAWKNIILALVFVLGGQFRPCVFIFVITDNFELIDVKLTFSNVCKPVV
jgi:hypothetical protein